MRDKVQSLNDGLIAKIGGNDGFGGIFEGDVEDTVVKVENSINDDYDFINDVINARLDTSTKKILSDFNFGTTDFAGAVKSGDIAWNTSTGAITGGSGVVVYRKGIVGASGGVTTFSIDATTGDATFRGTITASTITGGTLQTGTSGQRIVIAGADNTLRVFDSVGQVLGLGTDSGTVARFNLNSTSVTGILMSGSVAGQTGFNFSNTVSTGNVRGILIDVDSTTNNLPIVSVTTAGTAELFYGSVEGTGKGINIDRSAGTGTDALGYFKDATTTNANVLTVWKSGNGASGSVAIVENDGRGITLDVRGNNTSAAVPVVKILSSSDSASSPALLIDKNGEQYALDIDQDANSAGNTVAIRINVANNGAGQKFAFEFAGGEYDGTKTSVSGLTGVIRVLTSDGTVFIPVYSSAS